MSLQFFGNPFFGAEKKDTTGGGGLQTAGKGLQGAGASLTQAGTSLNTAASTLNQDVVPDLLRDIRDSIFGMEKATEKSAEWLGKVFRELGGTVKKGSAPQGQMGGIGGENSTIIIPINIIISIIGTSIYYQWRNNFS